MKWRTPISQRIQIEVDGTMRRLGWVAENRPQILLDILWKGEECHNYNINRKNIGVPAILSAFAKLGMGKKELIEMAKAHPEWKIDYEIFGETLGFFSI